MRRRSVTGPILLILLGAGFLVYNLRPDIQLFEPAVAVLAVPADRFGVRCVWWKCW